MKIVNGQRVYVLEVSDSILAVIHEGLMLVPYGRASQVVNAINEQLKAQIQPAEVPKTEEELMAEHHGRYGGPHA